MILTKTQFLKRYEIETTTLHEWKKKGLPTIKIGAKSYYDEEEVHHWMKEQSKKESA